jgi:hypothetical protein
MGAATETFYAKNRQQWRDWLMVSHQQKEFIWLIYDKKTQMLQRYLTGTLLTKRYVLDG